MDDAISVISVQDSLPSKRLEENLKECKEKRIEVDSNKVSYWNFLYVWLISVGCLSAASHVTLIPRHNTIFYPEFWYESIVLFVSTVCLRLTIATIAELYVFTKVKELISINVFLKLFFGYSMSFVVPYAICYATWTIYLDRNHPLPFIALCGYGVYPTYIVAVWYLFPPEKRIYQKGKIVYFILYRLFWFAAGLQLMGLRIIIKISSHIEWIIAILLPIIVKLDSWTISKIVQKITGASNEDANCLVVLKVVHSIGFFKATALHSASQFTVNCMLFVDLGLHMRTCYQIISRSKKVKEETGTEVKENIDLIDQERRAKFFDLVITELIEIMIPIVYGLSYATAYFGPNARLMKNVGSDWFGGEIMKDIQHFYVVLLELFAIDLICMVLTAVSLYKFCNLNVLQEFCKLLKKYWWMMMLQLSFITISLGSTDINFAMDYTGKFLWISDEGRYDLINNSSDLSENEKAKLLTNMS